MAGGQHDDGQRPCARLRTPALCQLQARCPGQHPVQQDEIRQHTIQVRLRGICRGGQRHLIAGMSQVQRHQLGDCCLVL
ncbi:hypothetical protein RZS08_03835, partial [Arthrospira platensis SPKY1]|nr:hypothetical protein [Arthrospira platensis SPKY1]